MRNLPQQYLKTVDLSVSDMCLLFNLDEMVEKLDNIKSDSNIPNYFLQGINCKLNGFKSNFSARLNIPLFWSEPSACNALGHCSGNLVSTSSGLCYIWLWFPNLGYDFRGVGGYVSR